MPLFYKVVLANLVIVLAAMLGTAWLTQTYMGVASEVTSPLGWGVFAAAVLLASLTANSMLVRLALSPLQDLEETARNVSAGSSVQKAPLSPLADRDLERIIGSFNGMLDRLLHYRKRLRELALRALTAQEEERKRIARELHDDTAQRITAVSLRLGVLHRKQEGGPIAEELERAHEELLDAVEGLRQIARGLRPPSLDELGLSTAIEAHAREMRERFGLQVEVDNRSNGLTVSPEAELAIYRIVQKALSNARFHANARHIGIVLDRMDGDFRIAIEDDGFGFDPPHDGFAPPDELEDQEERVLDLLGMKERASFIGGRVEVDSRPGKGTRITVLVPLPDVAGGGGVACATELAPEEPAGRAL